MLTSLASQPFLIGMVEHQFREPSPISTLRVIIRYWLGVLAIGLVSILGGVLLGFVAFILGKLGPVGRIASFLLMLGIGFYWLLGTLLLWPAAIYEERFSPWRAFKAMRGLRWRALASAFLLLLPFMLPAVAIVISAWPNNFAMMIKPPLGLSLIITFVFSVASACGFALVAHLYLAQRGSSAPSTPAGAALDAAGLS